MPDRTRLLDIIASIQGALEDHDDEEVSSAVDRFLEEVPGSDVKELLDLFWSSYDIDTILDIFLGMKDAKRKLTREELTQLVNVILHEAAETEAESVLRVIAFDENCLHPDKSDLIFYPSREMTVEEIVNCALTGVDSGANDKVP